MAKRTEMKVDTSSPGGKRKVIKAIADLQGIDKIEVNSDKCTVVVTGSVDPVDVIARTRKTGKWADILSVGPPPAPPKPEEKKEDKKEQKKEEKQEGKKDKKKQEDKKEEEENKPPPPPPVCMHIPSYHRPVVVVDEYCHTNCAIM